MSKNLNEIKAELSSGASIITAFSDLLDYLQGPAQNVDLAACQKDKADMQAKIQHLDELMNWQDGLLQQIKTAIGDPSLTMTQLPERVRELVAQSK